MEIIYHERNGEILIRKEGSLAVQQLIENRQPLTEFPSKADITGYFINKVYAIPGGLVILSTWKPSPGYSWSETIITSFPIPSDDIPECMG